MNTNHNRIKVSDLETSDQDKILITNENGELEFSDINSIKVNSYNGLDYTQEGKALDARQGKVLKDLVDNLNTTITSDPKIWNTIFVNNYTGNDSTAQFENPNRPFATMQKALEFQSSLEGWIPLGIKIVITNDGTYNMGTKMLSNSHNNDTNILLFNLHITGIKGTPTLVFNNGADIGKTTLDNVNIIHQALTNSPISGGLRFQAGNPNSFLNIQVLRFSNITYLGNLFTPDGLFNYVQINSIIIDNTCTNLQLQLSRIRTVSFAKIDYVTNNANSFSGSSENSIFVPPVQDFEFGSIINNSTLPINLWTGWSSTKATIKIGNIDSVNTLMKIPLGQAGGDFGLNTRLKVQFRDSTINNCWISGNTLNSQCYVSGRATFNYSLQSPFMIITRSRLNTDFSNKDTCVLKDLELSINYSITPTNPIILIPNVLNNGSAGMTNGEAQIILENVKIMTNAPAEIFRIPASSKLDTPRLIVFRGFNAFDNSKELINIAVTPTEPKFITSQKAVIYHPFNVLSNNPSLLITQEQSY